MSIFRDSTATLGADDTVQAHVEAAQAGQTRALGVKSEIYFKDRRHGREGAGLQAALKDGNELVSRGRLATQKS